MDVFEVGFSQAPNGNSTEIESDRPVSEGQYTWLVAVANSFGGTGTGGERNALTSGPNGDTSLSQQSSRNSGVSVATTIQSSIALPLPTNIPFSNAQDWSAEDANSIQIAVTQGLKFGNDGFTDFASRALEAGEAFQSDLVRIASNTLFKKTLKRLGQAHNPHRELFYNGPVFRTFSFEWEFAPVNAKDAKRVEDLIYKLNRHSAPDFWGETTQSSYKYPDAFEIEFVGTRLPRLKQLALTEVSVNYTASGAGPKFHTDGHSGFTQLSCTFMETLPITRRDIDELYNQSTESS